MNNEIILTAYNYAKEQYATIGVDTDLALKKLDRINISLHCWQTDDVTGFENPDAVLGGGLQTTGNYPGKARTIEQLKDDIEKVMSLLPGKQRLSLHAIYGDFKNKKADRDQIEVEHFQAGLIGQENLESDLISIQHVFHIRWLVTASPFQARIRKPGSSGSNISKNQEDSCEMGKQLGTPCINNIWIPDGSKDIPVDRLLIANCLKILLMKYLLSNTPKNT